MAVLRWRVAAGILSAGLALGVAELVAAFIRSESAPMYVLGSTVVDHTPDGLREWAISTFGTADKTVLFACMGIVAVVVAGLAGALERVDRATGSTLLVFFGLVAAFLAAERYGFLAAIPTVIGVAAGVYALRVLTEKIADVFTGAVSEQPPNATPSGRVPADATTPGSRAETGNNSRSDRVRAGSTPVGADATPRADTSGPAPTADTSTGQPKQTAADFRRTVGTSASSAVHADSASRSTNPRADASAPGATPGAGELGTEATPGHSGGAAESGTEAGREGGGRLATGPQRRELLRGLAITGGLAVLAGAGGRLFGARRGDVSGERAAVVLPRPTEPEIALLPDADLRVPGLTPYLTANDDFYRIDTALFLPQVSIEDWSLRIHGMVDREIRIGWADLARRPVVERLITLACVSNPVNGDLIGNALWRGYRLDELLAEAGPHPDADMVLSRSKDGWTAGTPLAVLTDGRDALLAVGMNGEPLPVSHGYPARLVVPGLYGYVSATKWVTELEVTRFDRATAYWTRRGWSAHGPIKTGTRIDTPRGRVRRPPGHIPIAGVAWAQHRGITAVEVQIDDGDWRPARLSTEQSIDTWRQWVYDWVATPGTHTLRARATDGTGETQTADRRDVIPDGATGHPTITLTIG
ncbi:molybdopterin-dependent oxidoreductase [Nocardia bhagyanarayanae]|uniref:DMSO/TMAO reductase YedYZ molybdopterin-dependent catalytic subunit n=1 Tax=Nocardia bhagyanarayanae TaxID=1215925 RepID=A0A543FAI1_9NOCA|nr:molybdopterin-dependent oxidoreductase [Nocardia bhagyanarayanae]TQM30790.1 DMSO/TMAO reductase YedYZ molybdopterin-dependent catalytic subunit [Nocardia bhagyanarayanae]